MEAEQLLEPGMSCLFAKESSVLPSPTITTSYRNNLQGFLAFDSSRKFEITYPVPSQQIASQHGNLVLL